MSLSVATAPHTTYHIPTTIDRVQPSSSMPTTSSSASNCSSTTSSTEPPLATLSYQDEQKPQPQLQPQPEQPGSAEPTPAPAATPAPTRTPPATEAIGVTTASVVTSQPRSHFTSSHHHYHLPHQFQHPHHQNHHTHSVRVPTPTVPSSYAPPALDADGRSPGYGRRAAPLAAGASATTSSLLSSSLLATPSESAQVASVVSPGRLSARTGSQHHVTIDESSLPHKSSMETAGPSGLIVGGGGGGDGGDGDNDGDHGGDSSEPPSSPGSSSQRQLSHAEQGSEHQAGQLTLMYHSHQLTNYPVMPAIKRTHRPSFVYPPMPRVKA